MLHLIARTERSVLVPSALALAAVLGWGISALSLQGQVNRVTAERDGALAQHHRLQAAVGELAQVEAKLGSARIEYARVIQGWAEAKDRAGVVQQELASLSKRLDQAKDRASQTGSIRPAEPPARPARKP